MSALVRQSLSIGKAPVLDGSTGFLPVDPYILGYWLGDGSSGSGNIAVQPRDFPSLHEQASLAGYETRFDGDRCAYVYGLTTALRAAGVLCKKHVPRAYLRAKWEDRLALLQGLMDSDGNSPRWGNDHASRFWNTNLDLVSAFCELVRSLGGKPRCQIIQRPGDSGGAFGGRVVVATKEMTEVCFFLQQSCHRLQRKAVGQAKTTGRRTRTHYVRSVAPAGTTNTVCIEVDSPDNTYLAGEAMLPTHNSILRTAYRPWMFKKRMEEIEGIGVERDLAGYPTVTVDREGPDIWNAADPAAATQKAAVESFVRNVRRNQDEGAVLPWWCKFELVTTGSRRNFDTNAIVQRYEQRIAMTTLADFILLGHEKVGSFALASSKTSLFSLALGSYLDSIAAVINRHAIPRLLALNGKSTDRAPTLVHGDIEAPDLQELGAYIAQLAGAGAPLFPDENLEAALRTALLSAAGAGGGEPEGKSRAKPQVKPEVAVAVAKRADLEARTDRRLFIEAVRGLRDGVASAVRKYSDDQPRDEQGRWAEVEGFRGPTDIQGPSRIAAHSALLDRSWKNSGPWHVGSSKDVYVNPDFPDHTVYMRDDGAWRHEVPEIGADLTHIHTNYTLASGTDSASLGRHLDMYARESSSAHRREERERRRADDARMASIGKEGDVSREYTAAVVKITIPEQPAPVVNVEAPIVNVPAPIVNIHVPEQAPPVVNVQVPEQPAPVVNVEASAPIVVVRPAEQAPPVVNVPVPEQPAPVGVVAPQAPAASILVEKKGRGRRKRTVNRDDKGRIASITDDPIDEAASDAK